MENEKGFWLECADAFTEAQTNNSTMVVLPYAVHPDPKLRKLSGYFRSHQANLQRMEDADPTLTNRVFKSVIAIFHCLGKEDGLKDASLHFYQVSGGYGVQCRKCHCFMLGPQSEPDSPTNMWQPADLKLHQGSVLTCSACGNYCNCPVFHEISTQDDSS